jgi:GT2 family glycosyltransferase
VSHRTTVLVLSVDEAPLLEHCLPAAVAQDGADVLVIDNACTDATRSVAESHGARVLGLRERVSYAAAINAGILASEGDAVLLLNADCVLGEDFLAAARERLGVRGVGSVAPRLIRATGMRPDERLDVLDAAGMVVDRRRKNTLVGHNEPASAYSHAAEVFGGDGACVLYRREVLEACAVGGEVFDEQLELWASDVDLAWRARLQGWRCMYEPRAVAWHVRFYSPTTRAGLPRAHRRLQFRNRLLMMAKNDSWADVRGDLHRIAFYELLAIGHVVLRERHLLGAYRDAARALPGARRRRRVVQAKRAPGVRPPFGLRAPR